MIRKSGGIGIYVKNELFDYVSPLDSQSDYCAWIKLSKKYTKLKQDVAICICYVPPQSSKYYNEDDFTLLEQEVMSYCSEFEYVFITGDLNAQTASMSDFTCPDTSLDKYLDLDQETINYFDQEAFLQRNNILVNRSSKDTKTNNTGHRIVELCKNNNLFILNGRFGDDSNIGNFTFRDQSVIDYTISSKAGFDILNNFKIYQLDGIYSDGHCLLEMKIAFSPTH